jgi:hypothetical protein
MVSATMKGVGPRVKPVTHYSGGRDNAMSFEGNCRKARYLELKRTGVVAVVCDLPSEVEVAVSQCLQG